MTEAENSLTKPIKIADVMKRDSAPETKTDPKRNLVKVNGVLRGPKPDSFIIAGESPLLPQISRTLNNKSEGTYRPQVTLDKNGNPNMMLMNDMSSFDLDSQDAKHISSTKDTKTGTRNTQARSHKAGY